MIKKYRLLYLILAAVFVFAGVLIPLTRANAQGIDVGISISLDAAVFWYNYYLSVYTNGTGSGIVSVSSGSSGVWALTDGSGGTLHMLDGSGSVTLSATANSGSVFAGWSVLLLGDVDEYCVTSYIVLSD